MLFDLFLLSFASLRYDVERTINISLLVIWNSGTFFLDNWRITENLVSAFFFLGPKKESHSALLRLEARHSPDVRNLKEWGK